MTKKVYININKIPRILYIILEKKSLYEVNKKWFIQENKG